MYSKVLIFLMLFTVSVEASKVVVATVTKAHLTSTLSFNGTIRFHQQSKVASQSSGVVSALFFNETDVIKKGDLLLKLDAQVLQAEVNALQSQTRSAKLNAELSLLEFKRNEKLYTNKGISKQIFDKFKYASLSRQQNYLAIKQQLKAQQVALKKKSLYAPFDGVIASQDVQLGEWLNVGQQVALLVNLDKVDLVFNLPQKYISKVLSSTDFKVTINDQAYKAKLLGKLLNGDASTRTFGLLLQLDNPPKDKFFQGMQARLLLEESKNLNSFVVPRDAIVQKYEKSMIYIVRDNKALPFSVKVLSYKGNSVAIQASGLAVDMKVIVKGNERLYPNAKVEVSD